ncbi:BTAD domain-containing putative transcriptional regulator [Micromonospora echinaurantiaca]|uniref:BTAD domain-containing putative transcriptional regulator n=1 Tax=Micromonospora echinaurantiaca TaxID=47857 RepID=UPI0037237DFD
MQVHRQACGESLLPHWRDNSRTGFVLRCPCQITGVTTMIDAFGVGPGDFAMRLRWLRGRSGLTQEALARRAGISMATVRDLEQGRSHHPRQRSVRALAMALGLSSEDAAALRAAAFRGGAATRPRDPGARDGPVRLAVLGPLAVFRGGTAVPLGAGRHRVVLGRLALTPNTSVVRDELVDLLWGGAVPRSAVNLVQTYVSRLRRVLEPAGAAGVRPEALTFDAGGYRLNIDPECLDLLVWRELLTRAKAVAAEREAASALLEQALNLWRGVVLADVSELRDETLIVGLQEERITAALSHANLLTELCRPDQALPGLRELARRHSLHEPLQARLVATLGAAGQQAAALSTYEEVRRRLSHELGIDPGPELIAAYRGVLGPAGGRASAGVATKHTWGRPFQTPAPPADFTGRVDELGRMAEWIRRDPRRPGPDSVTICAISGVPGLGKTALALRAAQLVRASFPDGQLYLDLHGVSSRPVTPLEGLTRFLRALGVDGGRVPGDEAECAALFRSVLAGRRMLVVLDNARDAAQVRSLVPGTGGNAVLVTSRNRLADLAGAVQVELGLPPMADALDMLTAIVGRARVAAEAEAAAELAVVCGRLPIALRVVGGWLVSRPSCSIRAALNRLADRRHRLDRLRTGDLAVEVTFHPSYQKLSASTARAFRLLASLPGDDFGVSAAAAALGSDEAEAEEWLNDLVDGNLLQVYADERYRYHDLLRLYALRRAEAEDPVGERAA